MPKIPTFTTEARPTAEAPSVQSRTQIPLSQTIGTALAPVTRAVTQHAVNCLLYTSPSPRDGLLSRMPSSA